MFTGLWTAIESAVSSFGALIFGAVLSMGGFVSSDPGRPVVQPDSAITAVLLGQTAVPAFIIFLAVLMTFRYRLTAEHVLHDPQQPSASGEIRPAAP
ncbi:MFS transporter [Nonomuraea dietziae]|uniref:MFS transporter n=1 Tax=Nonomuraea dietziae TaxID=65515 RepID=UPI0028A5E849|nr:MFS transporter [Nonomuraea dietziae]